MTTDSSENHQSLGKKLYIIYINYNSIIYTQMSK